MREKKTLKEYKAKEVKLPILAWMLDRHLVYTSSALVAVIAVGGAAKVGWDSYQNVISEPVVISPYQDIEPVSSISRTWASSFIKNKPKAASKWTVSENSKAQPILDSDTCNRTLDTAPSLLSTHVASGSGIETRVQVYGAGQSAKQYEDYVQKLKTCFGSVEETKESSTHVASFSGGFILNVGDTIISVTSSKPEALPELLKFYVSKAESTLRDSKCIALTTSPEDSKRSFYYDDKSYEGLKDKKAISTNVYLKNLPSPTSIKLNQIANESTVEPEAPLPEDFPDLPKPVETPEVPEGFKNINSFKDTATYLVADTQGPGCGWAWSAQEGPAYDLEKLEKDKDSEISTVQNYVNRKAEDYVNSSNSWASNILAIMPNVDNWNIYVNKTNDVHNKWDWLRTERYKIQTDWYNYVSAHENWSTFDSRKAAATQSYEEAAQKCEISTTQLEEWESEWGETYRLREKARQERDKKDREKAASERAERESASPTSSPTPSPTPSLSPSLSPSPNSNSSKNENPNSSEPEMQINPQMPSAPTPFPSESEATTSPSEAATSVDPDMEIPPRPEVCAQPARPSIIDQVKPSEPVSPTIPEGVTIPNSWPKPQK